METKNESIIRLPYELLPRLRKWIIIPSEQSISKSQLNEIAAYLEEICFEQSGSTMYFAGTMKRACLQNGH